jgi:uncharacterized membrane protein YqjE
MWRILLKLITLNLVGSKLHGLAQSFAIFLEHRSNVLAVNVAFEWERVFKSLIVIMIIVTAIILSLFIGFGWILAIAWHSEYRSLILGLAMGIPLIIAISLVFYLRFLWKKSEFLSISRELWKQDWETLQEGLKIEQEG